MSDEIITSPIVEPVETTTAEVVGEVSTPTLNTIPTPIPAEIEVKQEVPQEVPKEVPEVSSVEAPAVEEVVVANPVTEEKVEVVTPTVDPSPLPIELILKPESEPEQEAKLEPVIIQKPEINPIPPPTPPTPITSNTPSATIAPDISPLDRIALSFKANMLKARENLVLARKATKAKMMKSVYKVLDLFKKKKNIKNVDVQKFVHVSDSTATDYLNILTKEGKVKKEGRKNSPNYTKVE